jgi:hypothetical protein
MEQFADLHEDVTYKVVARDRVGPALVSTIWLGIDLSFGTARRPVIFETMVFGGPQEGWTDRWSTEDCARTGHMDVVETLLEGGTL